MNNERPNALGCNGRCAQGRAQENTVRMSDELQYGQMMGEPRGDLRTAPRLDSATLPRRRCDGSLREENTNSGAMHGWGLHDHPLAMVYSPYQHWRDTYTPEIALAHGTLFSELNLPFEAANCRRGC